MRRVEDAHARPLRLVLVRPAGAFLRVDEATEIRGRHPQVGRLPDRLDDGVEDAGFEVIEVSALQQVHDALEIRVIVDDRLRVVVAAQGLDFLDRIAEQEEVLVADRLADLDVGAVERADCHGAVHHELHVARAGSLLAGRRDLLRQFGGGADLLHGRHVVVGIEDHLQLVLHRGVRVDHARDVVDALDDRLRHDIAWRGLAADDDQARHQVGAVAAADAVVQVDRVQHVEQLALVLVDALDLHVEHHVGRYD